MTLPHVFLYICDVTSSYLAAGTIGKSGAKFVMQCIIIRVAPNGSLLEYAHTFLLIKCRFVTHIIYDSLLRKMTFILRHPMTLHPVAAS